MSVITDRKVVAGSEQESNLNPPPTNIYFSDTFTTNVGAWKKLGNTAAIAIENERLAVTTGNNNHGARADYYLYADRTYRIVMEVDKDTFTPDLEIGILKATQLQQSDIVNNSGVYETTFTPDESRNYNIRTKLKQARYKGDPQVFYLDDVEITDITNGNPPFYETDFSNDIATWSATKQATSVTTENERLKVVTKTHHQGANGLYYYFQEEPIRFVWM